MRYLYIGVAFVMLAQTSCLLAQTPDLVSDVSPSNFVQRSQVYLDLCAKDLSSNEIDFCFAYYLMLNASLFIQSEFPNDRLTRDYGDYQDALRRWMGAGLYQNLRQRYLTLFDSGSIVGRTIAAKALACGLCDGFSRRIIEERFALRLAENPGRDDDECSALAVALTYLGSDRGITYLSSVAKSKEKGMKIRTEALQALFFRGRISDIPLQDDSLVELDAALLYDLLLHAPDAWRKDPLYVQFQYKLIKRVYDKGDEASASDLSLFRLVCWKIPKDQLFMKRSLGSDYEEFEGLARDCMLRSRDWELASADLSYFVCRDDNLDHLIKVLKSYRNETAKGVLVENLRKGIRRELLIKYRKNFLGVLRSSANSSRMAALIVLLELDGVAISVPSIYENAESLRKKYLEEID